MQEKVAVKKFYTLKYDQVFKRVFGSNKKLLERLLEEILEETPEITINCQTRLDILPIIWENILMEIPMRVVSEDAEDVELSGDGWRLITDDEKKENSELSKLKDLL